MRRWQASAATVPDPSFWSLIEGCSSSVDVRARLGVTAEDEARAQVPIAAHPEFSVATEANLVLTALPGLSGSRPRGGTRDLRAPHHLLGASYVP